MLLETMLLETMQFVRRAARKWLRYRPAPSMLIAMTITVAVMATSLPQTFAAGDDASFTVLTGRTMGTTYSIKYASKRPLQAAEMQKAIDQRLAEIDARMSTYRDDSELSRFNQSPAKNWFSVSAETARVADQAIKISQETSGAFDPTVGPLVELWRFGSAAREANFSPPSKSEIQTTLQKVGFEKLQVRREPPALWKDVDGLQLDLSAIAKGYGVDQIAELVQSLGADRVMVEIGGEVRAIGGKTTKLPWRIGVEAPVAGTRRLELVALVKNQAMATSGNYRNFYEHEGVRYSHTIDPRTGWPTRDNFGSATILSASCGRADALATALLVMGADKGVQWARRNNVNVLFLNDRDGSIKRLISGEFPISGDSNSTAVEPAQASASLENAKPPANNFLTIVVLSGVVFAIALTGMAIGVIVSNRRIKGSCGGLAGMKDERGQTMCQACSNPSPECNGLETAGIGETISETETQNDADR